MLTFSENKKKRTEKEDDKQNLKVAKLVPAWHDKALDKLSISIEEKSRLRKLKQTEAETSV